MAGIHTSADRTNPGVDGRRIPVDLRQKPDWTTQISWQIVSDPRQQARTSNFQDVVITLDFLGRAPRDGLKQRCEKRMFWSGGEDEVGQLPGSLIAECLLELPADVVFDPEHTASAGQQPVTGLTRDRVEIGVHSAVKVDDQISEEIDSLDHARKRVKSRQPFRRPTGRYAAHGDVVVQFMNPAGVIGHPSGPPLGHVRRQISCAP